MGKTKSMKKSERFVPDPEKYARMAVPYPSKDDAGNSLIAFLDKVRELRESYRIAEVVVVAGVYVQDDEDKKEERVAMFSNMLQLGDGVAGYALAKANADHLARSLADHVAEKVVTPLFPE